MLLENVCTALTNITEEAIFPLIDFSGMNYFLFQHFSGNVKTASTQCLEHFKRAL